MRITEIRPANLRDACFIAANMRDQDRREIDAAVPFESTAQIAAFSLHHSGEHAYIAYLRGEPVAAFGITPLFEGTGTGWAFGTNRLRRAAPAIADFCRAYWVPELISRGFRRVEVRTLIDHDLSHSWLEKMGFRREGIAAGYGRHGEDFVTYAFVRKR